MKKLAIALAVSALAVSAQAQNVTVYGIIDTGFQHYDNGTGTLTRANDSGLNTSRIGFKGTEDLGGGLKANFQLEGQVNPSSGSTGSTTVATNETFNREAWVGLSGGFGEIRAGRQDVSYAQDIDAGVSQIGNLSLRPVNGTSVELGTDQKNVIKYITPSFGGVTAQLGWTSGNGQSATTDGSADQQSAALRYDAGALSVMVGYSKLGAATKVAERDFTAYGISYNFGVAKVGATYAEGDVSTTGDVTSKSTVVSAQIPLSKGLSLRGAYGMTEDGTQASNGKGTGYVVAMVKDLSKRTSIYAAYTSIDNESNSSMYWGGTTAPASAGLDTKATTVGLSHTF